MSEQKAIADVVLDTPEPDRFVDCGESRPLPMFHMHTLMQYGERCAEAALAWLRSQGEPVATLHDDGYWTWKNRANAPHESNYAGWRMDVFAAPPPAIPDGWRLVPVEPTYEMCTADWDVSLSDAHTECGVSECAWAAMLAAAPEPSK